MMRKFAVTLALASTALTTPALADISQSEAGNSTGLENAKKIPIETVAYQHGGWPPSPPPPTGGGGGGSSPAPKPSPTKPTKPG
jgi:hypothetical protein